jgi:hypothetical protein
LDREVFLAVFRPVVLRLAVFRPAVRRFADELRRPLAVPRPAVRAPAPVFRRDGALRPFAFRAGFLAIASILSGHHPARPAPVRTGLTSRP